MLLCASINMTKEWRIVMLHLVRVITSLCDNAVKKAMWPAVTACLLFLGILAMPAALAHGQSTANTFILPKYQILGVVYAPPGSASNVTYAQSDLVGTSNTIGSSVEQNYGIAVTVGADFSSVLFGDWGFGDTISAGWTATSGGSSTVSVQTQTNNAISTPGPVSSALGVNHDNDVIYIMLNPVMATQASGSNALSLTAVQSNSCDVTDSQFTGTPYQAVGGCDPNQYPFPDIVAIPVWCLKNPYFPGQSCAQWLPYTSRSWDTANWGNDPVTNLPLGPMLTLQDYADILSADPFVTQTLVPANTVANFYCHQSLSNMYSYGVNLDPNDAESITATPLPATNLTASGCQAAGGTYSSTTGTCTWPKNFCAPPASTSTSCTNAGGNFVSGSCAFTNPITAQRFTPFNTVQYPEPGINGEPQTYTGSVAYTTSTGTAANSTSTSSISNTLCVEFGSDGSCPNANGEGGGGVGASYSVTTGFTWTDTQSTTSTSSQTSTASYTIVGPQLSDNYTGPTTYNVYEDNVFGTFAFYSNLQREQPAIQLSAPPTGTSSPVWAINGLAVNPAAPATNGTAVNPATSGIYVSPITVTDLNPHTYFTALGSGISVEYFGSATACDPPTSPTTCPAVQTSAPPLQPFALTNNTKYQMTMAGPAITFSDPGFQVLYGQNSSGQNYDNCSNQVLLPGASCTIWLQFSPVTSDAPKQNETNTVTASLVAAGTENVSEYQNILVTSTEVVVSGTATAGSTYLGATLNCTPQNTACVNNQYNFGSVATYTYSSIPPETFTFTNTSSSTMTITQVKLSDSLDFAVNSIICSNGSSTSTSAIEAANGLSIIVPPGSSNTCTLVVAFTPQANSQFSTGITVLGTLDVPGASTVAVPLAGAAAVGTETASPLSVSPAVLPESYTFTENTTGNNSACSSSGTTFTVQIGIGNRGEASVPISLGGGDSYERVVESGGSCVQNGAQYLVPAGGCSITANFSPTGACPGNGGSYANSAGPYFPGFTGVQVEESVTLCNTSNNIPSDPSGCIGPNGQPVTDIVVSRPHAGQPIAINAGSSGSTLVMVTAGKNFSGNVSFFCQNLPANASCTFTPSTVTLTANGSQSTNLTISVAASNTMARRGNRPVFPLSALAALLCFAGMNKRNRSRLLFLVLVSVMGLASLSACGGSGAAASGTNSTSSTITVVATSGNVSTTVGIPITITQ